MKTELETPNQDSEVPAAEFPTDIQDQENAENFQKFLFELFEKNGILNDLRAYLRGHIVNVLRSAQTGDVPSCTKHFTQRLELPFQALNILIAEYFLRMEFSYSLSVFVSEIPLANMVFDYARSMMQKGELTSGLNFKQKDVWSILNYLGIKCDSDHATNIVEMYKSETMPLLLCILKCMPMYRNESIYCDQGNLSENSLSSLSMESEDDKIKSNHKSFQDKCRHTAFCKSCRSRILRIKEGYKKKKRTLAKTVKETNLNSSNVEYFMNNISAMERSLIDEMFEQLKTVYEAEMEMMKAEEDKKVKRSLATHSLQLRQQRDKMEESFKAREEELENNLQKKKKFLWGLARALREQHAQVARAQLALSDETRRLSVKEESLKNQLIQAEQVLRNRGEEMRNQISNELAILESHLESMKKERDIINRERNELEQLKNICDTNSNVIKIENFEGNETRPYELLRNEMKFLRTFFESTKEPKRVIERSTLTELNDVSSKISVVLNNEQDSDRNYSRDEERGARTPNQVVNDFKKQKNVNFSQSNLDEIYRERSRDRSRSSASSEAGDAAAWDTFERDRERDRDRETIRRLRDENERLKGLVRQQRDHIEEVWSQPNRQTTRADEQRTTVTVPPAGQPHNLFYIPSANPTPPNTHGWRKGAGEELTMFGNVQPRIVLPGDTVPFIGVIRDRHSDNRRHLISEWRALRRRMSPVGVGRIRTQAAVSSAREGFQRPCSAGPSIGREPALREHDSEPDKPSFVTVFQPIPFSDTFQQDTGNTLEHRPRTAEMLGAKKYREKSPKSLLREAKEKLRNSVQTKPLPSTRDKSPNAVLREAKLRLRKLEIEAEAVEKSYRDFRRRQTELRGRSYSMANEEAIVTKDVDNLDLKRRRSLQKLDYNETAETSNSKHSNKQSAVTDFEKYIREYQTAFETHFVDKSTVNKNANPIPESYSPHVTQKTKYLKSRLDNFLETPLMEFRNLYQSQKQQKAFRIDDAQRDTNSLTKKEENVVENSERIEDKTEDFLEAKNTKADYELEILKHNLKKMYNKQKQPHITEIPVEEKISSAKIEEISAEQESAKNLLRIEVENTEMKEVITESDPQNLVLVVETSVNGNEIESDSDDGEKIISANMTILIGPKRSGDEVRPKSPEKGRRSVSPEQAARLTRNDVLDAIFHTDNMKEASSIEMKLEISKEKDDISDVEKSPDDNLDDFSADVDNYNTRSVFENHSPISLPKTEDDTFWDS